MTDESHPIVPSQTPATQPQRRAGRGLRSTRDAARARVSLPSPSQSVDLSPEWEAVRGERETPGWRRDTALRRALALADVLAAGAALLFVLQFVAGGTVRLRPAAVVLVPLVVLAAKALGLYDRDQHIVKKTTIDEVPWVVYLSVLYAMTAWLGEELLFRGYLGRPEFFALIVASLLAFVAGRLAARTVTGVLTEPERCIILGNGGDAARVAVKLEAAHGVRTVVVGRVPLGGGDPAHRGAWAGLITGSQYLAQVISERRADRVIIAPGGHDQDDVLHLIRVIKAMGVKVSVLPRLLEVVGSSSTFEDVHGMTLLGVRPYGVSRSSALLKRSMDILGAAVGLLLLSPLLGFLALGVKLDSRGPVFFRQRRIGQSGEVFSMLKFRSMVENADEIKVSLLDRNEAQGGLFKISDDPRITRIGRLLRRTSLDELPQLLNVLGGSMSLVGPRPLVQDEDALIEGWQRRRLAVKPGMTGMWQIFGSSRVPMNEMVKIDYLYGANWSIWLDLKILLRTVPYVLRRRGL